MPRTASDLIAAEDRLGARNYKPLDVVLSHGNGAWVTDVDGARYLDCLSAYSAVNQGHCHPRILSALTAQAGRLALTSRAFRNDRLADLYEALHALTGARKVLPMNSGAEAVETALKAARKWGYEVKGVAPGKAEVIVCSDNFHGRTISIVGFSTDPESRENFGPFAPGFRVVPFGDAEAFERAIGPDTVAFLAEPIQGEAGVVVPPDGYLRRVRAACDRHRVLMVMDEIQTGLGRTGRMLAQSHEDVEADVTLLGKALSGGFYPVSAVLARGDALDVFAPGQHGSTFGGNPLACAVACAALDVLVDEGLCANAEARGAQLRDGFESLGGPVTAVRGRGLMLALDVDPAWGSARDACESLRRHGVLAKDTHGITVRVSPPLVVTEGECDWALGRFSAALSAPPNR